MARFNSGAARRAGALLVRRLTSGHRPTLLPGGPLEAREPLSATAAAPIADFA
jgi:hypothetical protein